VLWEVAEHNKGEKPSITFKYHSKDGEEGKKLYYISVLSICCVFAIMFLAVY
jgi:hypothetical protein